MRRVWLIAGLCAGFCLSAFADWARGAVGDVTTGTSTTTPATFIYRLGIGAATSPSAIIHAKENNASIILDGRNGGTQSLQSTISTYGARNSNGAIFGNLALYNYDSNGTSTDFAGVNLRAVRSGADDANFEVQVATNTALSTKFVVENSGYVGVGTDDADTGFDVHATTMHFGPDAASTGANLEFGAHSSGNRNAYIDLIGDDTYTDYGLRIIRGSGGANADSQLDHRGTGDIEIVAVDAGGIEFKTNNTGRMYIEPTTGDVGIGLSNPSNRLAIYDSSASAYAFNVWNDGDGTNATYWGMTILAGKDTPSATGDIRWVGLLDGNGTGVSMIRYLSSTPYAHFASLSDARFKKNVRPTTGTGLDKIRGLELVDFEWDGNQSERPPVKMGFVAQQVQQYIPEAVGPYEMEDGEKALALGPSAFMPYLVKAVQEQQEQIEFQQTVIDDLMRRVQVLEAQSNAP